MPYVNQITLLPKRAGRPRMTRMLHTKLRSVLRMMAGAERLVEYK